MRPNHWVRNARGIILLQTRRNEARDRRGPWEAPGANQALTRKVPPHLSQLGQARGAVTRSGWNQHRMTLEAPVRSFVSCSCCSSNGSNAAGLRDQFTAESFANAKLLFLVHLVLLYPPPRQHSGYPVGLTRHRSALLRVVRWIDIYLPRRREGSLLGKTIVGTLSCSSADIIESTKEDKGGSIRCISSRDPPLLNGVDPPACIGDKSIRM